VARHLLLGVVLAALANTGCASTVTTSPAAASADQGSPTPAASARAATISGPLLGVYHATIPTGADANPGEWGLTVESGRLLLRNPDGSTFDAGHLVSFTETEIVFAADPNCPGQDVPTEGRYGWTLEGTELAFELVSDSCSGRVSTLTSAPWERQP
jgi:hypothetical protein